MSRESFKNQVIKLCKEASYIAFGNQNNSKMVPLPKLNLNPFSLNVKVPIAKQIYEQYRKQGFKYADPGITPRLIAEEIVLHLNKTSDAVFDIDEFGFIIAKPTEKYFENMFAKCRQFKEYIHSPIKKEKSSLQIIQSDKMRNKFLSNCQNIKVFIDFVISKEMDVGDVAKIGILQKLARILEFQESVQVERNWFLCEGGQKNFLKIRKMINKNLMNPKPFQQLSKITSFRKKLYQNKWQYISCENHRIIHLEKILPNHTFISLPILSQTEDITFLNQKQMLSKIKQKLNLIYLQNKKNKINFEYDFDSNFGQDITKKGLILTIFGNQMGQLQFGNLHFLENNCRGQQSQIMKNTLMKIDPFY